MGGKNSLKESLFMMYNNKKVKFSETVPLMLCNVGTVRYCTVHIVHYYV